MKKKWIYLLTALLLAVSVCVAEPIVSGAEVLNLDQKCSMTISPEQKKTEQQKPFREDMNKAKIVVDIYKVADAKKTPGYDTYTYTFAEPYQELQKKYDEKLEILKDPNKVKEAASFWRDLSQDAGKILLGDGKDKEGQYPKASPVSGGSGVSILGDGFKGKVENLDHGLYMIIARNGDMSSVADYKIIMDDPRTGENSVNGNVATIANSDLYSYIFSPELISVPMRGGENGAPDVTGPIPEENGPLPNGNEDNITYYRTSDGSRWIYDIDVYLKPIRVPRYGSLAIEKKLEPYESEEIVDGVSDETQGQDEQVTFVFKAVWNKSDYAEAGSRVDSITFNHAEDKTKKIILERIPVGTEITVTEEYSGASYQLTHKQPDPVRVTADRIQNGRAILDEDGRVKTIIGDIAGGEQGLEREIEATISFTNTYNRRQKKGYGINNRFEYQGDGNWLWTSDRDSTGKTIHNGTGTAGGGNENIPEPDVPPTEPQEPTVPDTPEPQGTTETP